ncbi:beta-glucosidase [Clostridium sp. CS001]|uniref:GH1 family beta-glucosidase n=1 Tax=Clostridium sp. CS001 TaxID=2880648 RepID=UPI001CF24792|nr:GH1 family beta-glucosidase [Clostridium sp. CS001]MCB2291678.1 beta-glucosidase [Clostridium sp. CS001]
MNFDKSFIFGVATSSYQIEGAVDEDGRTPSIWDTFSKVEGKVSNMENGDIACDHYHRYKEDINLIKELGVDCYRLSIAWPRIFPSEGKYNPKGMEFYKNLLTELKEKGIKTAVTLYHWDLPQYLQDMGGWEERRCADRFLEYAEKCFMELDHLTDMWITHNEPWCASILSNVLGEHAPGKKDISAALKVGHHLLLSHGMAVGLYHKLGLNKPIGITLNLVPTYPKSKNFLDLLAASNADGFSNRWFLDPIFKGSYPFDIANLYANRSANFDFIKEGDFDIIGEKCDFLGVNYYNRSLVEFDPMSLTLASGAYSTYPKTDMGWDVSPGEFIDLIKMLRATYTDLPIYITENGSAWIDDLEDGCIHDAKRTDYLLRHLEAVAKMNDLGLNIAGYFCWSLLDNFEWGCGYSKRFGIVHVDFETQERIKKDSYYEYAKVIKER